MVGFIIKAINDKKNDPSNSPFYYSACDSQVNSLKAPQLILLALQLTTVTPSFEL